MIGASPSKVFSSVLADGQPDDVAVGQHESFLENLPCQRLLVLAIGSMARRAGEGLKSFTVRDRAGA